MENVPNCLVALLQMTPVLSYPHEVPAVDQHSGRSGSQGQETVSVKNTVKSAVT